LNLRPDRHELANVDEFTPLLERIRGPGSPPPQSGTVQHRRARTRSGIREVLLAGRAVVL
jgi:hypothetical protein